MQPRYRPLAASALTLSFAMSLGCGGATRSGPPQAPGKVGLTSAEIKPRVFKVLVARKGTIGMIARDGCVATLSTTKDGVGDADEMRVRCPPAERLSAWFAGVDRIVAGAPTERVSEDSGEEDVELPAAELVTAAGTVLKVTRRADAERILGELDSLSAELGAAEEPKPGPASASGWRMIRVSGPAHVFLAGAPTRGVLDARVSTTGQYLCEFLTTTDDGSLRATKSGWISSDHARRALDEVLEPFQATATGERPRATYAAAIGETGERRANLASTAQVFERFSALQDALGDACLPELDAPPPVGP